MGRPRGPDSAMATGIAIFMGLIVLAGIGVGALAGWIAARWVSFHAAWIIGCLTPPVLITTVMVLIFPEIFRSAFSGWTKPYFRFLLPAGFRGRLYLVADERGATPEKNGRRFTFDIPPGRVCRVKPFSKLEDAFAECDAQRPDGAPVPLQREAWGSSNGVTIRSWYVGTAEEQEADPAGTPDLAEQVAKLEEGS